MKCTDVFTPGKLPTITFIDDHIKDKQVTLKDALEMGGSVISLSGPSKSGKTVFIENLIGKDNLIQVTGAGIDSTDKLWGRVFDIIGVPTELSTSKDKSFEGGIEGKIGGEAGILIKGKGEVGAKGTWATGSSTGETFSFDYLQLLIRELKDSGFVLFIDDFHYIPKEIQVKVANQIKEAIRNNVKIICASVPYHSDDVIRANADLRGRTINIDFKYWNPEELIKIARKGFSALCAEISSDFIEKLASEAAGSPQLMQALCLNTCFELNIRDKQDIIIRPLIEDVVIGKVCTRTSLMTDYSSIFEIMKEGPKSRGEARKQYLLSTGESSDVYPLVLMAISKNPPMLTFRYPNLQSRIQSLCQRDQPSGSSITEACRQISLRANNAAGTYVMEWDGENDVLDIRDPYLLFYIRWAGYPEG